MIDEMGYLLTFSLITSNFSLFYVNESKNTFTPFCLTNTKKFNLGKNNHAPFPKMLKFNDLYDVCGGIKHTFIQPNNPTMQFQISNLFKTTKNYGNKQTNKRLAYTCIADFLRFIS